MDEDALNRLVRKRAGFKGKVTFTLNKIDANSDVKTIDTIML